MDDLAPSLGQHTAQTAPDLAITALGHVSADSDHPQDWVRKASSPSRAYR